MSLLRTLRTKFEKDLLNAGTATAPLSLNVVQAYGAVADDSDFPLVLISTPTEVPEEETRSFVLNQGGLVRAELVVQVYMAGLEEELIADLDDIIEAVISTAKNMALPEGIQALYYQGYDTSIVEAEGTNDKLLCEITFETVYERS